MKSLCHVYWRDSQRPIVLSGFISAGAEEWVDTFTESVIECVDVDFCINVVERHLWNQENKLYLKTEIATSGEKAESYWRSRYLSYFVHLILFPILHLSILKVHEYPNLLWSEVQINVCGVFRAKGVLVPKGCQMKAKAEENLVSKQFSSTKETNDGRMLRGLKLRRVTFWALRGSCGSENQNKMLKEAQILRATTTFWQEVLLTSWAFKP